ncbi:MAG: ribonuclease P protein component [Prevotellaceae bacterium]|jgi:ribonuclease P protein component|nr:ribonuclease P protein component [Prevotellaceae bacterium]
MKGSLSASEVAAVFEKRLTPFFSFPLKLLADVQPLAEGGAAVKTAFAVPKRLVKRATARNRLKRQMRAAFQRQEGSLRGMLATAQAYSLIFLYSDGKAEAPFADIEKAIYNNVKALANHAK